MEVSEAWKGLGGCTHRLCDLAEHLLARSVALVLHLLVQALETTGLAEFHDDADLRVVLCEVAIVSFCAAEVFDDELTASRYAP